MQHVLTCVLRQATPELMEQVGAFNNTGIIAYVCEYYIRGQRTIVYNFVLNFSEAMIFLDVINHNA